jgi:intein-encoded DNA endonuclease-like protein
MSRKLRVGVFKKRLEGKRADEVLDFFPSYLTKDFEKWRTHSPMDIITRFLSGETMEQIGKSFGVPKTEVAYALKVYGVTSLGRVKGTRKSCMIRALPTECKPTNPALGYILGVRYGDGCCTHDTFTLTVADKDFHSEVVRQLTMLGLRPEIDIRLSKVRPKTMCSPQTGKIYKCHQQFRLDVYGKAFTDFLDSVNLKSLSEEQRIGFVNGFADSEGCVERHARNITLTNTNLNMLNFVSEILTANHVHNTTAFEHRGQISKISGRLMKDIFRISIGRRALPSFHRTFKFSIQRKQDRLDRYMANYRKRTDEHGLLDWVIKNRALVENLRASIEKASS